MKNKTGSDSASGRAAGPAGQQAPAFDSPEWRTLWLRCLEAASAEWSNVPYNDLAMSGGEPGRLTHLVDMHYDLPEGEARRQVDAFLRACRPRF